MNRVLLSIAGVTMAVESSRDFLLTDRCYPFRVENREPDVTFRLLPGEKPDFQGLPCLHRGDHRSLYRRGNDLFYVCCSREAPDDVRWFTKQTGDRTDELEVFLIAEDAWNYVNPLTFVELSDFMIRQEVMILHSSLIAWQGKGIVFTAPSGTGKSTQAELWKRYRGADILNGDRAMLRRQDGYRAYGSPYAGSSGIYRNESVPLTGIVVLRQAPFNRLRRMKQREAYLALLSQMSVSPISRDTVEKQSQWLLALIEAVPVWLLECLPDEGAVNTLFEAWKEDCNAT